MTSGTAYRCKIPNWVVLPCDREPMPNPAKLYKAPRKKLSKSKQQSAPFFPLPLEIVHSILLELDLLSIGMLRRVNTAGRIIVESFPAYSLLKRHTSDTLRLMAATKCAQYFPISLLFAEFCQPWCRTCGDFGPFLYFPTATRSCYKCNFVEPEYEIAEISALRFHLALSWKQIRTIPIIHSLDLRPSRRFANITQAKALALQVHGSKDALDRAYQAKLDRCRKSYDRRLWEWYQEGANGRTPQPLIKPPLKKYEEQGNEPALKMRATATFPYWNRQTRTLESGVYCRACTYDVEEMPDFYRYVGNVWDNWRGARWEAYHRAFLEVDIPRHFLHCLAVKKNYNFRVRRKGMLWFNRRKGTNFTVRPRKISEA